MPYAPDTGVPDTLLSPPLSNDTEVVKMRKVHMSEQEVVNETPAETTVDVAPTATEATEAAGQGQETAEKSEETPVVESNDEDKVSKAVPYERFKEINDKYKDLEDKVSQILTEKEQPQYQEPVSELDPDAARAVQSLANQVVEQREAQRFEAKHAKDLSDPLVKAAFMVEVQETMAKGQYIDREAALEQAKANLESRLKPAQEKAKEEGIQQGQDIAKTKQQLGAVGETGKQPEVTDEQLSAAEYAAKENLPRIN